MADTDQAKSQAVDKPGNGGGSANDTVGPDLHDVIEDKDVEPVKPKKPPRVDKLFRAMEKMNASDLHFKADSPARVRVRGAIRAMSTGPMSNAKIEKLLFEIMNDDQRRKFEERGAMDFAYQVEGGARFRVNVFRQRGMCSMAARRISSEILPYEKLHLPPSLAKLAEKHQGLILVAGITGSGKSTTIASMIEQINKSRPCHIVTLEDPIEFQYEDKKAFINQREIGLDVHDFHDALKYLMRQDPDVVLIGEMRDQETFAAALHAAESGHLVFGTVHANGVAGTITRVLELFPENARALVRTSLVFNLQGIVCQKLLKTIRPDVPRVPCIEVCLCTATVRKLLTDGRDADIIGVIKSSYSEGMLDFNESLRQLVEEEYIDTDTAYAAAPNPEELKMKLKGINIAGAGLIG